MPELDNKTKEELQAIATEEEAQAEEAQKEADEAVAKAAKEAAEAAAAKAAADAAFAKSVAASAGTPVNTVDPDLETKLQEAWVNNCVRMGYNTSNPRPKDWNPFN
jgi:membrane protein involved in colicin uptake